MKASEFRKPSREECTDEEWVVSIMEKCSYNYESMKQIMENELKSAGEEGYAFIHSLWLTQLIFYQIAQYEENLQCV